MGYDYKNIETKWQKYWEEHQTFKTDVWDFSKPKFYALDMFPYPSGVGLHAGHPEGYTATDIVSRMKRMQGYNVLHPMGYDSFGLPAEQYAIQTGNHPEGFTKKNIETFTHQLKELGLTMTGIKLFPQVIHLSTNGHNGFLKVYSLMAMPNTLICQLTGVKNLEPSYQMTKSLMVRVKEVDTQLFVRI